MFYRKNHRIIPLRGGVAHTGKAIFLARNAPGWLYKVTVITAIN